MPVSVVIPTYRRGEPLINSIKELLGLKQPAAELIVVDQTETHSQQTFDALHDWQKAGQISWHRIPVPSITHAMNHGLMVAKRPLVLFLDDDISLRGEIVAAHANAHENARDVWATVGQVVQPWQVPEDLSAPRRMNGLRSDEDFPFHSSRSMEVRNVMAGNLCVKRKRAIEIGGMDENFLGSAYRFETEFARRVLSSGGRILFLGNAGIDHLRADQGGTRSRGSHLTSASPLHGMGDYYFAMRHSSPISATTYGIRRVFREISTKFHALHPWWIPVKFIGEVRAFACAYLQYRSGPKLLKGEGEAHDRPPTF